MTLDELHEQWTDRVEFTHIKTTRFNNSNDLKAERRNEIRRELEEEVTTCLMDEFTFVNGDLAQATAVLTLFLAWERGQ